MATDTLRMATPRNIHPADELAEVREKIRLLKAREDVLRGALIDGDAGMVGEDYEAFVTVSETERVSTAALKRELGMAFLRPYVTTCETTTVRVKLRNA